MAPVIQIFGSIILLFYLLTSPQAISVPHSLISPSLLTGAVLVLGILMLVSFVVSRVLSRALYR